MECIASNSYLHTSFLTNDTKPYPFDFPDVVSFTTRQSLNESNTAVFILTQHFQGLLFLTKTGYKRSKQSSELHFPKW